MERVDNKLTLVKLKFSIKAFNRLTNEEIKRLSETAQDFFHFIKSFGKLNNLQNYVELWLLKDAIQKQKLQHAVLFRFTFTITLSYQAKKVKYTHIKNWQKKAIETLLNELLDEQNGRTLQEYMRQMNITLT